MIKVAGVILAGGKSKRMGRDKSLLKYGKTTLLQRIIDEFNKILEDVYVVGKRRKDFKNATAIEDKIERVGPIAGLYTALLEIKADWYLVAPCDMPFLSIKELKIILEECKKNNADAIIAESEKGIEPLVAAYNKVSRPLFKENIDNRNYAIRAIFNKIKVNYIKFNKQLFEKDVFFNINYPDDYQIIIENEVN